MEQRRHGDEMSFAEAMRYLPYLLIVLALWSFAMTLDYNTAKIGERMRYEEACRENTRIAVAALGGEKLLYPDPHRSMWMVAMCEVHDTGWVDK
jgi:hypothetical protein